MTVQLHDGIPSIQEYNDLLETEAFRQMESYSDAFLKNNRSVLDKYVRQWVKDPFHQWSRQWEYMYVASQLLTLPDNLNSGRVLDAGSGATFFPYYVSEHSTLQPECCDYDESLKKAYDAFNKNAVRPVRFSIADMRRMPYEDERFSAIYCVSVLEHTDDYETIVDEFYRILLPGGRLIVTFDISPDGRKDIDVVRGQQLLDSLHEKFFSENLLHPLFEQVNQANNFTTLVARNMDESLLPWKKPGLLKHLESLVSKGRRRQWPPLLTFYCLALNKPV